MNCVFAREKLTAFLCEELDASQSAGLRRHLEKCSGCHEEYEYQARLISPLRELPRIEPPADLAMQIRVRLSYRDQPGFWERWQVYLSNFLRPVALPAAGGLLTALMLFAILMPAVAVSRAVALTNDVPTVLSTEPQFKQASFLPLNEDILVEAWIDEQGRVSYFQVLNPVQGSVPEKALQAQLNNVMLTTFFEPATRFGQPTASKVLLALRRINIRG
jgi:hypothetical protein